MNKISYTEAVNLILHKTMEKNHKSVCIGLGLNDPKRIFGTTKGLLERFGSDRCIEPPTSENALTGISFGLALQEYAVCLTHQRFDFALLSLDQIINTVSKWSFMYGRKFNTSLLIRLIVGRGWGQGPTHSQSYHSFLNSIPGLDIYYPYSPSTVMRTINKGMQSGNPSIMIEHRWLHNTLEEVNVKDLLTLEEDSHNIIHTGDAFTIFTYGYMVPEAIKAAKYLSSYDVKLEVITTFDLTSLPYEQIIKSLSKTKKLLLIEPFYLESSLISTICTRLLQELTSKNLDLSCLKILSLPFENESTSYFDTVDRYNTWLDIVEFVGANIDKSVPTPLNNSLYHDIPGDWFKGPF